MNDRLNQAIPAKLPFQRRWPLLAGVVAGLALRLVFSGGPGQPYATMMASFIFLSPMLVGAVTVYVAELSERRTWLYYIGAPALASVLYVAGTLIILIEGWICALLILPMFALLGAVGGLIMGLTCRLTNSPRPTLYSFALLPLLLGSLETNVPIPERMGDIQRSIVIDAPAAVVWEQIENARDIRPEEVDRAWMYRIGVPLPEAGITQRTSRGLVRRITMGKGVHFDQVVVERQPERYVRWTYHFDKDSFPPAALDDHVKIGGRYFDMRDTSYALVPEGNETRLTIRMHYRVSTQFNWYANPIATMLIGNFEDVILEFYRRRSEAARQTTQQSG